MTKEVINYSDFEKPFPIEIIDPVIEGSIIR